MTALAPVCFCNTNIPWGGGENWHYNAARSLLARGYPVLIICHPEGELYTRATALAADPASSAGTGSLTVIPLAIHRLSFLNPLTIARLRRIFQSHAVDSLIMNLPSDLKAAGPAAVLAGVRHIIYRRGSALPVRDTALNRWLYGRVLTGLIANSEETLRQVLIQNPHLIPLDRVTILPNSIDLAAFDAALEKAARAGDVLYARETQEPVADTGVREASQQKRPFVLGNAGRLNRQKGQHFLLYLTHMLREAGLDVRVLIAGTGEREEELRRLAQELGLQEQVIFAGFLHDLSPFWNSIDLFVLTSLWEGFGNVLLEAMLARKPIFAFNVSNIPELICDGDNGRLFPLPTQTDEKLLASEALQTLAQAVFALAQHPEDAVRMGDKGRAFAMRFSQDACMDALEHLIQQG